MASADAERIFVVGIALEIVCNPWYYLGLEQNDLTIQAPGSIDFCNSPVACLPWKFTSSVGRGFLR